MPADSGVRVEGLRELQRAFSRAGPEARKLMRDEMRDVAEPVKEQAEQLTVHTISGVDQQDKWAVARIGVTTKEVFIVPKQKGVGRNRARKRRYGRPAFGALLMERAYGPALEHNQTTIVRGFEHALDQLAKEIDRRGNQARI